MKPEHPILKAFREFFNLPPGYDDRTQIESRDGEIFLTHPDFIPQKIVRGRLEPIKVS